MTTPTTAAGRALLADKHWGIHAPLRGCILPCSAEAAILAIETEARAAPDPAPLDEERLARALGRAVPEPDDEHEYTVTDDLWYAAAIAREYAKDPQP